MKVVLKSMGPLRQGRRKLRPALELEENDRRARLDVRKPELSNPRNILRFVSSMQETGVPWASRARLDYSLIPGSLCPLNISEGLNIQCFRSVTRFSVSASHRRRLLLLIMHPFQRQCMGIVRRIQLAIFSVGSQI